jgi:hypothetical protein
MPRDAAGVDSGEGYPGLARPTEARANAEMAVMRIGPLWLWRGPAIRCRLTDVHLAADRFRGLPVGDPAQDPDDLLRCVFLSFWHVWFSFLEPRLSSAMAQCPCIRSAAGAPQNNLRPSHQPLRRDRRISDALQLALLINTHSQRSNGGGHMEGSERQNSAMSSWLEPVPGSLNFKNWAYSPSDRNRDNIGVFAFHEFIADQFLARGQISPNYVGPCGL